MIRASTFFRDCFPLIIPSAFKLFNMRDAIPLDINFIALSSFVSKLSMFFNFKIINSWMLHVKFP